MRMVNIGEAKTNLSRLIRQVEQGEEVIIARDGQAVVKLVRVDVDRRPRDALHDCSIAALPIAALLRE